MQPSPSKPAKAEVAQFWNSTPCGSQHAGDAPAGSPEFLARTEAARDRLEPFIAQFARFQECRGLRVLEVGCGTGVDQARFARQGAQAFGVDITALGCQLTAGRLRASACTQRLTRGDCERLPLRDACFDVVYSWGVIHHSPDTPRAARELMRVLKPGGRLVAMIYNRHSLVAVQAYLRYGVLRGHPTRGLASIIASHLESPGTKAYTPAEARELFPGLLQMHATTVITPYDLRYGRNRFLPRWLRHLVPRRFGYFIVVEGLKATG